MGREFQWWADKNFPEMDGGDGHNSENVLGATELST